MTYLKGGYVLININDSNIYNACNDALINGKPILLYENESTCYYIDSISKSGDDIILIKGGKTFTITDANVVSSSGDIQTKLYMYIFSGQDSNNLDFYVKVISSKKFDTLTDLLNGLDLKIADITAEDSTHNNYQWVSYGKTETELQFEDLYDREQNTSLLISTLDNFITTII